jgi:hypothetical protein
MNAPYFEATEELRAPSLLLFPQKLYTENTTLRFNALRSTTHHKSYTHTRYTLYDQKVSWVPSNFLSARNNRVGKQNKAWAYIFCYIRFTRLLFLFLSQIAEADE